MNTFVLTIQDRAGAIRYPDVVSFVGVDGSGSFGILAGHAPMITVLETGLARFRDRNDKWTFVGTAGGVLQMRDDQLTLTTQRSVVSDDCADIASRLEAHMRDEAKVSERLRQSFDRLERAALAGIRELYT